MEIHTHIAQELRVAPHKVAAAVKLLDGGATVPFVARYRKEATGGLDDTQLRHLETRLRYLRELEQERERVLQAIGEQGKLTDALQARILAADTKSRLEDLYLPFRKKRRTKARIARERGLEPLLDRLLADPRLEPHAAAASFVDEAGGVPDTAAALEGARQILMERASEDADLLQACRERLRKRGLIVSQVLEGKEAEGAKFRDWFQFSEPFSRIPSHRVLALLRGREQGILSVVLRDDDAEAQLPWLERRVLQALGIRDRGRPADTWLVEGARKAWRLKVSPRAQVSLMVELRQRAEEEAIRIFAENLRDLLMAAPAGPRAVLGLDPGLRTGVKVAVVDQTGKVLETGAIYPHPPRKDWQGALATLRLLVERHRVELVAIGNGTASRETDRLVAELQRELGGRLHRVVVSEAGASVYSASELAAREFPQMDVSLRGAVSIARRLQDPLAELVKIEPRSIGVGQYQHDVNPADLGRSLDAVVEDCVNAVGVDLNTASAALLGRVAGLGSTLAANVVAWRDAHGAFRHRRQLLEVSRLGPKTFEQCAGFLRIRDGDHPLDASAVHPEAYPVVQRIAHHTGRPLAELVGDAPFLRALDPRRYTDDTFGLPTVKDILQELEKPGRDPRPQFQTATFKEGVETLQDLLPGMLLEGTVTNLTGFGAFVDIGVHQDGLVHVSQMADHFVHDPRQVVKTGQVVQVRVLEVNIPRKRIALSLRLDERPRQGRGERTQRADSERPGRDGRGRRRGRRPRDTASQAEPRRGSSLGTFGDLLKGAGRRRR